MHSPIHQSLTSPTYHGPNVHLYSSSNAFDDADIMSNFQNQNRNHSSNPMIRNRIEYNGHLNGSPFSQTSALCSRGAHLQHPAVEHATPVLWPSGADYGFDSIPNPPYTAETMVNTTQSVLQNNPTLAPEPSLKEFDLGGVLLISSSSGDVPQRMDILAQPTFTNHPASIGAPVAMESSAAGGYCPKISSNHSKNTQDVVNSLVDWQPGSDFDWCGVDLSLSTTCNSALPGGTASTPPLPELPTYPEIQFEFLDSFGTLPTDTTSDHVRRTGDWSSSVPGYVAQYPDPEEFSSPYFSTPALTSASATSSRQQAARAALRDTSTDARLVELRREGKSYKQIKDILGLEEAESTLRGRYRTLTKPKEARVRKPDWNGQAVSYQSSWRSAATNVFDKIGPTPDERREAFLELESYRARRMGRHRRERRSSVRQ